MTSIACEAQKERLSLNPADYLSKPRDGHNLDPMLTANAGIELNVAYQTVKNHRTTVVYPVEVKKDSVVVKESLDRKDSRTLSLAQFLKFYSRS